VFARRPSFSCHPDRSGPDFSSRRILARGGRGVEGPLFDRGAITGLSRAAPLAHFCLAPICNAGFQPAFFLFPSCVTVAPPLSRMAFTPAFLSGPPGSFHREGRYLRFFPSRLRLPARHTLIARSRTQFNACHPDRSSPAFSCVRFLHAGLRSGGTSLRFQIIPGACKAIPTKRAPPSYAA